VKGCMRRVLCGEGEVSLIARLDDVAAKVCTGRKIWRHSKVELEPNWCCFPSLPE
jgi:hypothetical protein